MKRACTWLLGVLLAGCPNKQAAVPDAGSEPAGPVELTETEPNDRFEQAMRLAGSSIVTGEISIGGARADEDWYALPALPGQAAAVTLEPAEGADLQVELLDADRNRLHLVNQEKEGGVERFPNLDLRGARLLKVTGAKKGPGGAYILRVMVEEAKAGFEVEPNERAADANAIPLGEPIAGFIGHGLDEDWYRLELGPSEEPGHDGGAPPVRVLDEEPTALAPSAEGDPEPVPAPSAPAAFALEPEPGVPLRIELGAVPGVRHELTLLSEAEATLFQVRSPPGEGLSLRNVAVRAADRVIYAVIRSAPVGSGKEARRHGNADEPYQLTISLEEAGANAEFEPNDELAKATPLPPHGFKDGFLAPKGDRDYYVLRTEQPVLAHVQLSGVERVDLSLELVAPKPDGKGEESLLKANDGQVKEPEQLNSVRCHPACYFKVEGASRKVDGKWVRDYENSEQAYRLSVSTVPDVGAEEQEPNNGADTATPLAIGQPIRGTIHPRKDVDFYRLDLSSKLVRTPLQATVTGILKVDLGLYLHRVGEEGELELVQTAERAKGEKPEVIRHSAEPGVYLLEVRDSSRRNEANFQDRYQLVVTEQE
jgi:hypothetical protein